MRSPKPWWHGGPLAIAQKVSHATSQGPSQASLLEMLEVTGLSPASRLGHWGASAVQPRALMHM
jgi:hypothetical protein